MTDLVRVDTMTVQTLDGPKQYNMLVMGDPCEDPEGVGKEFTDPFDGQKRQLVQAAPELECVKSGDRKVLRGAMYTDHGYPAIGFLFTDQKELDKWKPANELYNDWDSEKGPITSDDVAWGWGGMCAQRARQGYSSGMGLIFRVAAQISPIPKTGQVRSTDWVNTTNANVVAPGAQANNVAAGTSNTAGTVKSPGQVDTANRLGSNTDEVSTNSSTAGSPTTGASLASQSRYPGLLSLGSALVMWYGTCWTV